MNAIQLRLWPIRPVMLRVSNTITLRRPFRARRRPTRVTREEMRLIHVLIAAAWNRREAHESESRRCAEGVAMSILWAGEE